MNAQVVMPFRSLEPHRVKLQAWVQERWESFGYEVTVCDDGEESGPFGRSRAVNRGVASTDSEYVIVADADIALFHQQAETMVWLLDKGHPWVIGYTMFQQMTRKATESILTRDLPPAIPDKWVRWRSTKSVCGLLGFRREDYISAGGFDERMRGWGGEDTAFAWTMDTLVGEHVRVAEHGVHLWHPQRADRKTDTWATANKELEQRYQQANGDPDAMTILVREGLNVRAWS